MNSEQLAGAARYMDELADEKGLLQALQAVDMDMDSIIYVAQQRALRMVLALRGEKVHSTRQVKVNLSVIEQEIEKHLTLASLDGICIGLAAAKGLAWNPPSSKDN